LPFKDHNTHHATFRQGSSDYGACALQPVEVDCQLLKEKAIAVPARKTKEADEPPLSE
jgi:hypothetical protein